MSVLLTTEGTYPYHKGGVSTWCHALTRQLSEVDYTILAIAMHPYLPRAYEMAPNVRRLITVPLWGTEDPAEYGWHDDAAQFLRARWQTTGEAVATRIAPAYERFLREAIATPAAPFRFADALVALHEHFQAYDYRRGMSDPRIWTLFVDVVGEAWRRDVPQADPPSLGELAHAWRLLFRLLTVLAAPVPRTDLTHSAAAAFCGIPCVISKIRWGTPFVLTEHGVYVREQYLNLSSSLTSWFVRWFLLRIIGAVSAVNQAFVDQLSPVCRYNTRWEQWRGADPERIHVIYNGVDPQRFSPASEPVPEQRRPLIVNVGLIFPLKGQIDLIDAAALVRQSVPEVEFRLYGSASDQAYFARCQAKVAELGLERTVVFAGSTTEPWEVYRSADVVAIASISEAFPYSLIEAMLCGAAVVATDVGGVSEALAHSGVLVTPRDPAELAEAIETLLRSPEQRRRLGQQARARALEWFTEQRFVDEYRRTYERLAATRKPATAQVVPLSAGRSGSGRPALVGG